VGGDRHQFVCKVTNTVSLAVSLWSLATQLYSPCLPVCQFYFLFQGQLFYGTLVFPVFNDYMILVSMDFFGYRLVMDKSILIMILA
jgi:hypothetical protein